MESLPTFLVKHGQKMNMGKWMAGQKSARHIRINFLRIWESLHSYSTGIETYMAQSLYGCFQK